jgi:hypothetical protein
MLVPLSRIPVVVLDPMVLDRGISLDLAHATSKVLEETVDTNLLVVMVFNCIDMKIEISRCMAQAVVVKFMREDVVVSTATSIRAMVVALMTGAI